MSSKLSDKSDSEEEVESSLSSFLGDEFAVGSINLDELEAGGIQELDFELPECVETEGHRRRAPDPHQTFSRETLDQMRLKFMTNEKNREALNIMFGSFTDIEPLMDELTEYSGLKKRMLRPGTGRKLVSLDMVVIHYMLGVEYMDELIESTYDARRPRRFRVDNGEVIPAMDIGLLTMRVGETSKFLANSNYAFGTLGIPLLDGGKGAIPPESRVMIQVQVLEAFVSEQDNSISRMSTAERQDLPCEQLLSYAEELKRNGNREFMDEEFDKAIKFYLEAFEIIKEMTPLLPDDKTKYMRLSQQLCNNLAHAYFKIEKFKRALKYAESGTKFPVRGMLKAKSHYWCAKILFELANYEKCNHHIEKADMLRHDKDIKALKDLVSKKIEEGKAKEKEICSRMMAANISGENGN